MGVFILIGVAAAGLLWCGTIAVILLNNVVPIWPFAVFGLGVAAALFIVDVLTEGEKK
jgi:hypothetical protein